VECLSREVGHLVIVGPAVVLVGASQLDVVDALATGVIDALLSLVQALELLLVLGGCSFDFGLRSVHMNNLLNLKFRSNSSSLLRIL
jgi:hypothetical protein